MSGAGKDPSPSWGRGGGGAGHRTQKALNRARRQSRSPLPETLATDPGNPLLQLSPTRGEEGDGSATGRLADNIAYFAPRAARRPACRSGPARCSTPSRRSRRRGVGTREDFYWTLHAVFVKRHEHSILFDQAFRIFWRRRALIEKLIAQMSPIAPGSRGGREKPKAGALRVAEALAPQAAKTPAAEARSEFSARLTVSEREVLQGQGLRADVGRRDRQGEARSSPTCACPTTRCARAVSSPTRTAGASTRAAPSAARCAAAARSSTLPSAPARCATRRSSRSSTSPARWPSTRACSCTSSTPSPRSGRRVHSFVFATRLTNISRELVAATRTRRSPAPRRACRTGRAAPASPHALHDFNRRWSRRVLAQGAVVLLFTDGLERQVTRELAFEMDRLKRSCRRLVWLNPLLRFDAFEARAAGIRDHAAARARLPADPQPRLDGGALPRARALERPRERDPRAVVAKGRADASSRLSRARAGTLRGRRLYEHDRPDRTCTR